MTMPFNDEREREADGPPGKDVLAISLATLSAILGTPFLFDFVGPIIGKLIYEAYGSKTLADMMYYASFVLSGVIIYTVSRMALWYAIAALIGFTTVRFAGFAAGV